MLLPWIIEQIKRKEEQKREESRIQPVVELPLPNYDPSSDEVEQEDGGGGKLEITIIGEDEEEASGVTVIKTLYQSNFYQ